MPPLFLILIVWISGYFFNCWVPVCLLVHIFCYHFSGLLFTVFGDGWWRSFAAMSLIVSAPLPPGSSSTRHSSFCKSAPTSCTLEHFALIFTQALLSMAHAWVSLAPTLASLTETLRVDVVIGGHWGSGRKGEECQDEMLPNLIIPICRQTVKMILSICWHILWSFQNSILFDETPPLICVLCTRLIILNMFLH